MATYEIFDSQFFPVSQEVFNWLKNYTRVKEQGLNVSDDGLLQLDIYALLPEINQPVFTLLKQITKKRSGYQAFC